MRFAPLALLGLLAVSGTPALTGCDTSPDACEFDTTYATEDITPAGTDLGAQLNIGDCVALDYVGRLDDGDDDTFTGPVFDDGTLQFFYQSGGLIPGFFLGLTGLQVGQSRRIRVTPDLGYGTRELTDSEGNVTIPACSTLEFEVTLRAIYQDPRQCR